MQTWEMSFNGRHWYDMPGTGSDEKKINFAAYRRGLIKMEEIEREVAGSDGGGMVLVAVPGTTKGLAWANYNRAKAAAKRGRHKLKVVQWNNELTPSQRTQKKRAQQAAKGREMRARVMDNAWQKEMRASWATVKLRCEVFDRPLQMLRDAWKKRGGLPHRIENLLHANAVIRDESEMLMFRQALASMGVELDERDRLRARAMELAATLDLRGVRAVDFCARCGISAQMLQDLKRARCRATGEKLRAMVAELERLTRGGQVL
jgi:hypothetical protein